MAARKKKRAPQAIATDAPDEKWRARNDLEALSRADEIRRDVKRMSAARIEARRQMKSLASVAGDEKDERYKRLEDVEL